VQQLTPEIAAANAHLFAPRDAYRFNDISEPQIMYEDWSVGENPPNGASINYWLGDGEGREVQVRVENSDGETLATLDGSSHDGFNRVWWNFRGPDANPIQYRTKPQFADWMPMPEVSRQVGGGFFGFGGGPRQPRQVPERNPPGRTAAAWTWRATTPASSRRADRPPGPSVEDRPLPAATPCR